MKLGNPPERDGNADGYGKMYTAYPLNSGGDVRFNYRAAIFCIA